MKVHYAKTAVYRQMILCVRACVRARTNTFLLLLSIFTSLITLFVEIINLTHHKYIGQCIIGHHQL